MPSFTSRHFYVFIMQPASAETHRFMLRLCFAIAIRFIRVLVNMSNVIPAVFLLLTEVRLHVLHDVTKTPDIYSVTGCYLDSHVSLYQYSDRYKL